MNATEKQYVEKLKEYNAYLKRAIHSESIINNVTSGVRDKFESEISALEQQIKEGEGERNYPDKFIEDVLINRLYSDVFKDGNNVDEVFDYWQSKVKNEKR